METFDKIIDFTRTTSGSYVDSDGKIKITPANKNLYTFTQELDSSAWTKSNATVYPVDITNGTLSAELATNGSFDSATGWTLDAGWTISGGVASISSGPAAIEQPIPNSKEGKWYRVQLTVSSITAGAVYIGLVAVSGTNSMASNISTAGTYTYYLKAAQADSHRLYIGALINTVATIDNVSIKEITSLIEAPDGTYTGDMLIPSTGNNTFKQATQSVTVASATTYTYSAYVKYAGYEFIQIQGSPTQLGTFYVNFNLQTGLETSFSAGTSTIVDRGIYPVGNGWLRVFVTLTSLASGASVIAVNPIPASNSTRGPSWAANGTSGIYIWGQQLEVGTLTEYSRNNGGLFPARFDYDPVTLEPKGLLIEEQRTNIVPYSEDFTQATWSKVGCNVVFDGGVAPDGSNNSTTMIDTAAGGALVQRPVVPTVESYTFSVFVKKTLNRYVALQISGGGLAQVQYVSYDLDNLAARTVGAGTPTHTATSFGNGWFRISITTTFTSTAGAAFAIYAAKGPAYADRGSLDVEGASLLSIWGAQIETGPFPSSYIPTQASQVTRSPDVAVIYGPNFYPWFNISEGTLVVSIGSAAIPVSSTARRIVNINDGSENNRITVAHAGGTNISSSFVTTAGVAQTSSIAPTGGYTTPSKLAYAFKNNDFAISVNGAAPITSTSGTLPINVNRMMIGNLIGGASQGILNGHVRSIKFYPKRLTNAQLQELSL